MSSFAFCWCRRSTSRLVARDLRCFRRELVEVPSWSSSRWCRRRVDHVVSALAGPLMYAAAPDLRYPRRALPTATSVGAIFASRLGAWRALALSCAVDAVVLLDDLLEFLGGRVDLLLRMDLTEVPGAAWTAPIRRDGTTCRDGDQHEGTRHPSRSAQKCVHSFFQLPPTGLADGFGREERPTAKRSRIHPNNLGPRFAGPGGQGRHRDSAAPRRCRSEMNGK